jgi:hypothetical protein
MSKKDANSDGHLRARSGVNYRGAGMVMKLTGLSLTLAIPALLLAQAPADPAEHTAPAAVGGSTAPGTTNLNTPLTPEQKLRRRALRLIEPVTLATSAASAGLDQWRHVPHNWDEGTEGYAIRFASAEGYTAAHNTIALMFDYSFHLDPRYHRLAEGGVKARFWNAVSQSFLAYNDSGGRTINVSEIGGNFGGGFIQGTWMPPGYQSATESLERGALGLLSHTGKNVVREFLPNILHRGKQ